MEEIEEWRQIHDGLKIENSYLINTLTNEVFIFINSLFSFIEIYDSLYDNDFNEITELCSFVHIFTKP